MFEGLKKKLADAVKIFARKEEQHIEEQQQKQDAEEMHQPQQQQPERLSSRQTEVSPDAVQHAQKPINTDNSQQKAEQPAQQHAQKTEQKQESSPIDIRLSLKTKLKGVFLGAVSLDPAEVDSFLETLRESMLESNVAFETTDQFVSDLRSRLLSQKVSSRQIKEQISDKIRQALLDVLNKSKADFELIDLVQAKVKQGQIPVKILFLGPNGTGKTTTIAKLAHAFKSRGIRTVLSASDTFRAAAIEQTEHHANKVGVPVIKGKYGADPASIAFDAIAYANAHHIDVVLIDSAGRQETNKNLINEMQKMVRVAKPDLTIFIGESIAGNMIAEQVKEFSKHVKIDGIVLTKLDCDPKGGNAISIAHVTGVPVLYFGVGESYDALQRFDPEYIVNAIVSTAS